jgi:PAS domain S-box-containing protein
MTFTSNWGNKMDSVISETKVQPFHRYAFAVGAVAALLGLYWISRYNYPLFHSVVEAFSILIAFGIFVFTWNCRRFPRGSFLLLIGVAYLFVGGMDTLHTFAYKGLNIFRASGSDLATQLWIAGRYLEAGSLFVAALLVHRKINPVTAFLAYLNIFALIVCSIFFWKIFPACYVGGPEGAGSMTAFKLGSEYFVCGLLAVTALLIYRRRKEFNQSIFLLLMGSIGLTIGSELSFTLYRDVYGMFNVLGHFLKVGSYALLYKAILETGLVRPYNLVFQDLQESRSSLRREKSHMQEVLKQMPAGVVIADAETQEVVLANDKAGEVWGKSPGQSESLDPPADRFFRADGTPYQPQQWPLGRALRWGEHIEREQVEMQGNDGSFSTLLVNAAPVCAPNGQIVAAVSTFHDVTERQRMEDSLRRARKKLEARVKQRTAELARANETLEEEVKHRRKVEADLRDYAREWRTTFDAITEVVCLMDLEGNILKYNRALGRLVDTRGELIIGSKCWDIFGCDRSQGPRCPHLKMTRTRKRETAEITIQHRHYRASADPLEGESGELQGCVHILRDITEQKKAEQRIKSYQEELRSLADELSLAEERERRRLSTTLHDNIAQSLALAKIKLGVAQQTAAQEETCRTISEIRELIDESIGRTRSLIFELSPPILYQMGLEPALETLADNFAERHELPISFSSDSQEKPLRKEMEVVLFQSTRELLINAVKYADASRLDLSLSRRDGQIRVSVADDGVGFDTSKIGPHQHPGGGFGLFNIQERLDRMDGQLEISSRPGEGTTAVLLAPVSDDTSEPDEQ